LILLDFRDHFSHSQPSQQTSFNFANSIFEPHLYTFKMSGRLDQPLDSIIESQKKAKREARRRKVGGKPAGATAPVGGVKKSARPVKNAIRPTAGALPHTKSSKIVVSGLVRLTTSPCF
jgi:hypothetical protein